MLLVDRYLVTVFLSNNLNLYATNLLHIVSTALKNKLHACCRNVSEAHGVSLEGYELFLKAFVGRLSLLFVFS